MKMGLLKSVNNVPGIDYYDYRETDYWNKFKYRARLRIPGARFLYYTNNLLLWKSRVNNYDNEYRKISDKERTQILSTENIVKNFMALRTAAKKNKDCAIRIEGGTVAIFSNDLNRLHAIKTWDTNVQVDFTEVQVSQFSGTKFFVRQPKYNYRVYLKSKRVENTIVEGLQEFLSKHKTVAASKGLKKWLRDKTSWKYRYSYAAHFIDYNDASMLSYMGLCFHELMGKKYKLEKREQTV